MKNRLLIIGLLVFAGVLTSCDHNNPNHDKFSPDPQSGYIEFPNAESFSGNAADSASVPVALTAATNPNGLSFKVDATILSGNSGGNLGNLTGSIPADQFDGSVAVPINSSLGEYKVGLTLAETGRSDVTVGLDTLKRTKTTLLVCNDKTVGDFIGYYGGQDFGEDSMSVAKVTIDVAGFDDAAGHCILHSANLWGDFPSVASGQDLGDQYDYNAIIVLDDNNNVTVTPADPDDASTFPGGTGTFDPATSTFDITLDENLFQGSPQVHVVIHKQ